MNAPIKPWTDTQGLQYFCRHLVGLCVTYRHKTAEDHGKPDRFAACSGTLIIIEGMVCFLTAGHVLKTLDELRVSQNVEITSAVLADTFGLHRICDHPIPFDLTNARLFYIDDSDEGLDFGVIALEPYYVRLLAKNDVIALEEKNCIHQSTVSFDGYAMLGLPEEFGQERVTEAGEGIVSPTIFRVHRLESPPEGTRPTRYPRFVGRLDRELPIKSVTGMSGGPIFGFSLGPQIRYWIVALQSSWLPEQRIVFGCPLPVLASLLTKWARETEPV
jgi:hypothetical protein